MAKRIFLYTEEESKRKDYILSYTERLLEESGVEDPGRGLSPEQRETFIELLKRERTPADIKADYDLLNRKWFYLKPSPSYEDTGKTAEDYVLNDEFLLDGNIYRAYIKWECILSDTVGLGILKSFEIKRDSEVYKLLKVSEFEVEALTKETISNIRKLLGLEDYSFIYSIDRPPLFYLACSLLSFCVQDTEKAENYESIGRSAYHERANLKVITELLQPNAYINTEKDGYDLLYNNKKYDVYAKITSSITDARYTDFEDFIHGEVLTALEECITQNKVAKLSALEFSRRVANKQGKTSLSKAFLDDVETALKVLNSIRADMDLTDYMIALGKISPGDKKVLEGPIITFYTDKEVIGGHLTKTYIFTGALFLPLAKSLNRIQSHKRELLTITKWKDDGGEDRPTEKEYSVTKERIAVNNYMLRRLEMINGDKEQARKKYSDYLRHCKRNEEEPTKKEADFLSYPNANTIVINNMFESTGVNLTPNAMTDMRKYFLDLLRTWQEKGAITDFEIQYKGKEGKSKGRFMYAVKINT